MVTPLEIREGGSPRTFEVGGELDLATADLLVQRVVPAASIADGDVVLDVGEVTFIDSAGVHALARISKALPNPHRLVLANLTPQLRRVIELTGLDQMPGIGLADPPGSGV
jgi:anti-sigma B factor antagonist